MLNNIVYTLDIYIQTNSMCVFMETHVYNLLNTQLMTHVSVSYFVQ